MSDVAQSEVLEHELNPWRPSRGAKVALGLVLVLLVLAAVGDHRARKAEEAAIDRCAQQIESVTRSAMLPVTAMANYVRSSRDGATKVLGRDLDRMVSRQADSAATTLAPAYRGCGEGRVLWHHWAASDRKQGCLAELDAWAAYFEQIRADGGTVFRPSEPVRSGC